METQDILLVLVVLLIFVGGVFFMISRAEPDFVETETGRLEDTLDTPLLNGILTTWKIIAGIFSVLCVIGIVASFMLAGKYRTKIVTKILPPAAQTTMRSSTKPFYDSWKRLLDRAREATPETAGLFIVEADSIVDQALQHLGTPGADMGERLRALQGKLSTIESLWEAHKLRNRIAHTPGYKVTQEELQRAIHIYHKTLQELELI